GRPRRPGVGLRGPHLDLRGARRLGRGGGYRAHRGDRARRTRADHRSQPAGVRRRSLRGPDGRPDRRAHQPPPLPRRAGRAAGAGEQRGPGDVSCIVFTSGTTGGPKGAMLTHHGLLAAADATLAARPREDDDVYLFPFPLCHVAAYNVLVQHRAGRPLVLLAGFEVVGLQEATRRHRVTSTSLCPTMAAMLVDHPAFDPRTLPPPRTPAPRPAPPARHS